MGARYLLQSLAAAGLTVTADGDRLVVSPSCRLTDELRAAIRAWKFDLLAELVRKSQDRELPSAEAPPAPPAASPAPEPPALAPEPASSAAAVQAEPDPWADPGDLADDLPATDETPQGRLLQRMAGFGMDEASAGRLVALLDRRDADWDDRRSCVECSHWTGRTCLSDRRGRRDTNAGMPVDVLHRCPAFGLAKGLDP
jgi:hypothetical protein